MYPVTVSEALLPKLARRALPTQALRQKEGQWWSRFAQDEEEFFWVLPQRLQPIARERYMGEVLDAVRGASTVVDYGCGNGWTSRMLAKTAQHVVGLDFSRAQLDLAAQVAGFPNVSYRLIQGPEDLPAAEAYVFHGVLHHLTGWEVVDLFQKIKARAKPGASIIVIEPHCYPGSPVDDEASEILADMERCLQEVQELRATLTVSYSDRTHAAIHSADERWWGEAPYGPSPMEKPFEGNELAELMEVFFSIEGDAVVQYLNASQAVAGQLAMLLHDEPALAEDVISQARSKIDLLESKLIAKASLPDTGWYMRFIKARVA
jgi:SAM-dependent methyltransferase